MEEQVGSMSKQNEKSYQSPQEANVPTVIPLCSRFHANISGAAKVVVCCLGVHACAVARSAFCDIRPNWFDDAVAVLLVGSTLFGVGCSVFAIRHQGSVNRVVGVIGLLWFTIAVLFAIAQS